MSDEQKSPEKQGKSLFVRATNILTKTGGGGNRTRVPWHFDIRFYVCSPLMLGVLLAAFVSAGSNEQDPATTIGQIF